MFHDRNTFNTQSMFTAQKPLFLIMFIYADNAIYNKMSFHRTQILKLASIKMENKPNGDIKCNPKEIPPGDGHRAPNMSLSAARFTHFQFLVTSRTEEISHIRKNKHLKTQLNMKLLT